MPDEFIDLWMRWNLNKTDCSNCPWMNYAIAELGVTEKADKTKVDEYKTAAKVSGDLAWCGCFVEWCMQKAKVETTRAGSLAGAKTWLSWGKPLAAPRFGAVTVLNRPPNPGDGHVAFFVREFEGKILLLGGNQNDSVCLNSYEKKRLLSYRWSIKTYGKEMWA